MATTTKLAAGATLTAVYGALNVVAITTTLGCSVFERVVPQGSRPPYLRVSTPSGVTWDTFGKAGKDRIVQVHVFGSTRDYESQTQVNSICDKVVELLQHQAITVSGHTLCSLAYENDTDGADEEVLGEQIVHRVISFRAHMQEAA